MRFKKRLQQPGARGTRPGHHHGSDTPASARAILHHTDQKGPNILTGVYACCINQSYQSIFFHKKYRKLLILKKSVFLSLPFLDFFSKDFFFCFIPMYTSQRYHQGWVKILMIALFSSQKLPNPNISVPSAVYRIKLMTTNQKEQMRPRALFLLTRGFEFCVQPIKITYLWY